MYPADERPAGVVVLVALFALEGVGWLVSVAFLAPLLPRSTGGAATACGLAGFLGVLDLLVAYGLWTLAHWSWTGGIALSAIGVAAYPIGLFQGLPLTLPFGLVVSLAAFVFLFRPSVMAALGEKRAGGR